MCACVYVRVLYNENQQCNKDSSQHIMCIMYVSISFESYAYNAEIHYSFLPARAQMKVRAHTH